MRAIVRLLADKEVLTLLHKGVINVAEDGGWVRIYGTDEEAGNYVESYDRNDLLSYGVQGIPEPQWGRMLKKLRIEEGDHATESTD